MTLRSRDRLLLFTDLALPLQAALPAAPPCSDTCSPARQAAVVGTSPATVVGVKRVALHGSSSQPPIQCINFDSGSSASRPKARLDTLTYDNLLTRAQEMTQQIRDLTVANINLAKVNAQQAREIAELVAAMDAFKTAQERVADRAALVHFVEVAEANMQAEGFNHPIFLPVAKAQAIAERHLNPHSVEAHHLGDLAYNLWRSPNGGWRFSELIRGPRATG
eukprot:1846283-Rhodomonas_salina.1